MSTHLTRLAYVLRLALLASLLSLSAVFIAQYGFGLKPCHLCVAQRIPFFVVIALALLSLRKPQRRELLVLLAGITFLLNSGLAGYHAAVERHWLSGPSGCTNGTAPAGESLDDFLKRIESAPIVACDQPQWEFHGVTMASINAVWCLFLAALMFTALRHSRKKANAHA